MLKGLYSFQPINEKTLGFEMNDHLLFIEPHPRDKNWLRVANRSGRVGLVPINYVDIDRQITTGEVISFIDEAIRNARRDNRSQYVDIFLSTRQNFSSNAHSMPEFIAQLEKEVGLLKSKAISEMSNEDDNRRSSYTPRNAPSSAASTNSLAASVSSVAAVQDCPVPDTKPITVNMHCKKCSKCHEEIIPERLESQRSSRHRSEADPERKRERKKVRAKEKEREVENERMSGGDNNQTNSVTTSVVQSSNASFHSVGYAGGYASIREVEASPPKATISAETYVCPPMKITSTQQIPDHGSVVTSGNVSEIARESCSRRSSSAAQSPTQSRKLAGEMIEAVRNSTALSHEMSQVAVYTVLQYMQSNLEGNWSDQLGYLLLHLEAPRAISKFPSIINQSSDAQNLRAIFNSLTECKDDEQQRSWALHEDESMILEYLEQLNVILNNADPCISKYVMEKDHYNSVHALVLYYQMETRWSIRNKLLDNFALMSTIDNKALSVLLNSILPMELAREIRESEHTPHRMSLATGLLVILLSVAEPIPITHFEHLGLQFLHFVFDVIENPPNDDEKVTDEFMSLLFAYNLQFKQKDENLTITALAMRNNASVFTQKLIYFLNREVDPIAGLDHEPKPPHSVFKLTTDVFSSAKTAELFYTNDIKVLIDIVTRCLTDLGAGDKRRNAYLKLIRVIVRNSNFCEHQHRRDDILHCFTSILLEEDPLAIPDQQVIRDIAIEFPNFFSKK